MMIRSASISQLAPEFDDFLFAPISEDRDRMLLIAMQTADGIHALAARGEL